ncbi:MAG TPA: methyltransferase domain-containing protein [Bacilli bacterium]
MDNTKIASMPGHWLLAKLGKRVLRPGGIELTKRMLNGLNITNQDHVVEFAPGMGITARMTLDRNPLTYTAIERDEQAARRVSGLLNGDSRKCVFADAAKTGLPDQSATVLYGEAMLTMQSPRLKKEIIREAYRVLQQGGKYGVHELCLMPDRIEPELKKKICRELSESIRVNAAPLTIEEWQQVFAEQGFTVVATFTAPMHLLKFKRMIEDEGWLRVLRISFNLIRSRAAYKRVLGMMRVFNKYKGQLGAVSFILQKK